MDVRKLHPTMLSVAMLGKRIVGSGSARFSRSIFRMKEFTCLSFPVVVDVKCPLRNEWSEKLWIRVCMVSSCFNCSPLGMIPKLTPDFVVIFGSSWSLLPHSSGMQPISPTRLERTTSWSWSDLKPTSINRYGELGGLFFLRYSAWSIFAVFQACNFCCLLSDFSIAYRTWFPISRHKKYQYRFSQPQKPRSAGALTRLPPIWRWRRPRMFIIQPL